MSKPIVRYSQLFGSPRVGFSARIVPVDHPTARLNGGFRVTSTVLSVESDGIFETRNTTYMKQDS